MRPILCTAALVLLAACGGRPDASTGPASATGPTSAEAPPANAPPPAEAPPGGPDERIEAGCAALVRVDQRDDCGLGTTTVADCTRDLMTDLESLPPARGEVLAGAMACVAGGDSCDHQLACLQEAMATLQAMDAEEATDLPCNRADQFGPAQLSPEEYAARHGAGITRLPDLASSQDQPVEVCGVPAQQDFLLAVECADGSKPFASRDQIRQARTGNVGAGGRCGTVIDLYEVPCPEKTYEVYMDLYYCQAGQTI
jgi:hypothetical protein